MITVEEALRIALKAHEGQKDLDGNPVILHPMAVAVAGRNREEHVAGLLHDVVEDTGMTFDDLQHNLKRGSAGCHYKQVAKHENALAVIEPLMNRRKK